MKEKIDIGPWLDLSFLAPLLKMAVIRAIFQSSGNIPGNYDLLKRSHKDPPTTGRAIFK